MYADDTLIVCKSNDIREVTLDIQNALVKMFTWCTPNKLSINFSKTNTYTGNFSQQYYDFDIINNLKPIILPKHHLNITSNLYKSIITKKLEQINMYSTHSFIYLCIYLLH